MPKQIHPSDSTEQQLAHKEILALLNEKYVSDFDHKMIKNAYFRNFYHILINILLNKLTFVNL